MSAKLVCLLPARNAEAELPGYFDSVSVFADAVVALDDGSTDGTRALLESNPLVRVLETNPVRTTYRGWEDVANQNRVLRAAAALEPEWVLFLDADERIPEDDGAALRRFLDEDAIPGFAYGFEVFRMIDDLEHYDGCDFWVYRLFAYEPGLELPGPELHAVPVPRTVKFWTRTTVRIQHVAGLTVEQRAARLAKYTQADPDAERGYYEHLIAPPASVRRWEPRPSDLAVVTDVAGTRDRPRIDGELAGAEAPLLSAIVISQNDEERIERVLRSIVEQDCPASFEVVLVTSGTDRTAEIARELFPAVRVVELQRPALPGEARNAGLQVARGDYISFPGSHVELPPGSLAARMEAHELGFGMVTGSIVNGTDTPSGWASYFLDHSTSLPGRPSTILEGPPAHCSYERTLLLSAGSFREDLRAGEDTQVNFALFSRGVLALRYQPIELIHRSRCTNVVRLVRHHFQRGRGWGRLLLSRHLDQGRLVNRRVIQTRLSLRRRLTRTSANVEAWGGELRPRYRRVYPLVVAGAFAAWLGTWYELLRPGRGKARVLFGAGLASQPQPSTRD